MKVFAKDEFKVRRIKHGLNVAQLAEMLGITRQMVAQVERRENGISPDKAKRATEILECEFDDIFELVERGNG